MTSAHAPALRLPRVDVAGLLARVRRRRGGGEPQGVWLHLHDVPRASARTTSGDVRLTLQGACLYGDGIVFRFVGESVGDATIVSMTTRLGDYEATRPEPPIEFRDGDAFGLSWMLSWDTDDIEDAP